MAHVLLMVENVSLARDHRLRKEAEALVAAGREVTIICPRDQDNPQIPGVRLLDYRPPREGSSKLDFLWEYGYSWVRAAALTLRARPFDAMQISGTPDIYFTIAKPFQRRGIPLVLDQRDLSPEIYESRYGAGGLVHRALLWWERRSFRAADHVLVVNESLRDVVQARGDVPASRVSIVGNGPRLSRVLPADAEQGDGCTAVWVGLMGPQDRLDLMLRAVAQLVKTKPQFRLVLIGEGEERPRLEQMVVELGLQDHVTFTGWLAEKEVFAQLRAADVGLEPNLEKVVSPVKVMEYLASGLPFVAFDLPQTRAVGGAAGEYVDPGDVEAFTAAVGMLLDRPDVRTARAALGRRRVLDSIAWEHQEKTYLDVYRRLLDPAQVIDLTTSPQVVANTDAVGGRRS